MVHSGEKKLPSIPEHTTSASNPRSPTGKHIKKSTYNANAKFTPHWHPFKTDRTLTYCSINMTDMTKSIDYLSDQGCHCGISVFRPNMCSYLLLYIRRLSFLEKKKNMETE